MLPTPTHIYPDGSRSYRKPKDGEIFHIMKNGLVDAVWQFDDMMAKWVNVTTTKHYNAVNTATHVVPNPPYGYMEAMENEGGSWGYNGWGSVPDRCECGSSTVKHPGHSYWCKLYVKP